MQISIWDFVGSLNQLLVRFWTDTAQDVEHDCCWQYGVDDVIGEDGHEAQDGEELGFVLGHGGAGFDGVVAGVVGAGGDFVDDECVLKTVSCIAGEGNQDAYHLA